MLQHRSQGVAPRVRASTLPSFGRSRPVNIPNIGPGGRAPDLPSRGRSGTEGHRNMVRAFWPVNQVARLRSEALDNRYPGGRKDDILPLAPDRRGYPFESVVGFR